MKVRLTAQIAEYATAMTEAANKTRAVGTESERLAQKREAFQKLGTGMTVVGGAMTALTLAVAKTGIEYNTLQQTSRAALTTLLGGAEAANAQMDKLDAFARTSPFSKAVFIQAQQQMIAFGIETKKVIPYLDAVQNAVAASGGSNEDIKGLVATMSKIQSSAKLTATDLMEFGNRGVDAAGLIGASMGKTGAQIRSEITKGSLDAGAALDALVAGMNSRFAGAADNVKQTFGGAMDRVNAAWRDLSADMMKPLVDPNGGGALVDILNWAADAMRAFQALPEPIRLTGGAVFALMGVVTLATGAVMVGIPKWIAFKQSITNLGLSMRGLLTTGGLVGIALTALVAVIGAVASAQAAARQRADDYAAALQQGEGAVNRFISEQLAMEDSFLWMGRGSAVDNAKKLGLSVDEVTKAVTGTSAEFETFKKKVEQGYAAAGKTVEAGYAMEQLTNKVTDLRDAHGAAEKKIKDTTEAEQALSGTAPEATQAFEDQEQAAKDLADALKGASDALDGVAGAALSVGDANDKALKAINDMTSASKDAKDALDSEKVSIAGTNDESIKFRDSIRKVEEAHRDSADAIIRNGGTLDEASAAWDKGREAVLDMLDAKGMDREEAIRWADQNLGSATEVKRGIDQVYRAWLNLPENKQTKYEVEKAEAEQKLAELKASLANMPTYKKITLETFVVGNRTVSAPGADVNANGGIYHNKVKAFANSGFEPGIYPYKPGGIHKFAEEYSEAYISGDPRRRARSEQVWVRAGQEFGFSAPQQAPVDISGLLDGVSISGTLDLGNGLTGMMQGVVSARGNAVASGVRNRKWGDV